MIHPAFGHVKTSGHVTRAKERMKKRIKSEPSTSISQIYKEVVFEMKNSLGINSISKKNIHKEYLYEIHYFSHMRLNIFV